MEIMKSTYDCNTREGYLYVNRKTEDHNWKPEKSLYSKTIWLCSDNLTFQLTPTEAVGLIQGLKNGLKSLYEDGGK